MGDLDDATLMKNCMNARNLVFARMRADPGVINGLPVFATAANPRHAAISLPDVIALPDRETAIVPTVGTVIGQDECVCLDTNNFAVDKNGGQTEEELGISTVYSRKCRGNCLKFAIEGVLVGSAKLVQMDLCTCGGMSTTEDITKLLQRLALDWQLDLAHFDKGFYFLTEKGQTVRELRGNLRENLQDKSKVTFHVNSI